jgi:hypothetical protein
MPKTLRNSAGALMAVTAVAAVGCGSGDTKSTKDAGSTPPASAPARAPKDLKPVDFTVKSLAGTVRSDTIILRGTTARGATLEVDSAPVTVNQAGKWRKTVRLSLGRNTFHYRASMPGTKPVSGLVGLTRKHSAAELARIRTARAAARERRAAARAAARARRANERVLQSAESYLAMSGFSKKGLYEQLSSSAGEGFTQAEAQYAVDHVDADWNKEAVESARSYLQTSPMSKAGLIEQLSSSAGEGFTYEQALYAVSKVY